MSRPARKLKAVATPTITDRLDIQASIAKPQQFPWAYADESVKEIVCAGVLEYIPGKDRGRLMDEIYRILVPGGTVMVSVLYWTSSMAYHDYRFEWPPIAEQSFLIFNKDWRAKEKPDLDLACDFDFTYGFSFLPETAGRSAETQAFHVAHYTNAAQALQLVLTKK